MGVYAIQFKALRAFRLNIRGTGADYTLPLCRLFRQLAEQNRRDWRVGAHYRAHLAGCSMFVKELDLGFGYITSNQVIFQTAHQVGA